MMLMARRSLVLLVTLFVVGSCSDRDPIGAIQVTSTDDQCEVASTSTPSGTITFEVTNQGGNVTEFYLYEADGLGIVGEVEDIGPGVTRELVVEAPPGEYLTACKPGMSGEGIRAPFTVTD